MVFFYFLTYNTYERTSYNMRLLTWISLYLAGIMTGLMFEISSSDVGWAALGCAVFVALALLFNIGAMVVDGQK